MKVSIIGTGYVGLVTGACLADVGNQVLCLDVDETKIQQLKNGIIPIYEPGLEDIVARNIAQGRLHFTTNIQESVHFGKIQMIAVGTPPGEDGSADLQYIKTAAKNIGELMTESKIVINKSTVPVGSGDLVKKTIQTELKNRNLTLRVDIVSNPEFLKEGAAIEDFMRPDRIIVGTDSTDVAEEMKSLYAPFQRNHDKMILMDVRSAELTKYAANAMLATRISFMNDLSRLADALGADIEWVRKGIGSDPRIGSQFLYPGVGFGGSCFPKDVKALLHMGNDNNINLAVLEGVELTNRTQKTYFVEKVLRRFNNQLSGKTLAIWGLAFKPNTDDVREAPSIDIINQLIRAGSKIQAYDPVATNEAQKVLKSTDKIKFCKKATETLEGADALLVITEWTEFRALDFQTMKSLMKGHIIFDGRNIYNSKEVTKNGFEYFGLGRPSNR